MSAEPAVYAPPHQFRLRGHGRIKDIPNPGEYQRRLDAAREAMQELGRGSQARFSEDARISVNLVSATLRQVYLRLDVLEPLEAWISHRQGNGSADWLAYLAKLEARREGR